MLKKPLFIEMFILSVIVGVFHYVATAYHLYWFIREFDSLVHFIAGVAISLFFLWLYFYSCFFNPPKRNLTKFLIISILGAIFVAVFWEIFELLLGETLIQKTEYAYDTSLDLIMVFLGAMAGCFYGYLKEYNAKF